jgi:hypothetical protein
VKTAAAGCLVFLLSAHSSDRVTAQSASEIQIAGGLTTASFAIPQGKIHVHFSSDAAPGDTISGAVMTEPGGATPRDQQANLRTLSGLVVEMEGQKTSPSTQRYEWTVPAALRSGRAVLMLRNPDGRLVAQMPVPIDPQPPIASGAGSAGVVLPADVQVGRPAIIRGRFDGTLRNKTIDVGGGTTNLLAASPRQVVFRVTQTRFGEVPIRFTDRGRVSDGMIRAIGVRLTTMSTQLSRGERAMLTTTVTGLAGIKEPATLAFRNLTSALVQIGGEPRVTIQPRDVKANGTYVDTRRLTGVQPGAFQILASVSRPALSRFDVAGTVNRVVAAWEVRARFRIAPEARDLIQRSVLDARRQLDEFLGQQEMNGADAQSLFQSLLAHYCYDLRDNRLSAGPSAGASMTRQPVLLATMRQPAAAPEVTSNEVRQWSFSQFLADLVARASSQSIGYLFITSSPERAPIMIDGHHKSEVTNRRFVTSVGSHVVQVTRPSKPCRVNVMISALQTSVVNCD